MWCPRCRGEYVEGSEHCPRCDVPLVGDEPAAEAAPRPRRLALAAMAGICGVVLVFLVRSVGTFLVVADADAVAVLATVQLLGYLAFALFFWVFFDELARVAGFWLRATSSLMVLLVALSAALIGVTVAAVTGVLAARPQVFDPLSGVLSVLLPAAAVGFFAAVRAEPIVDDRAVRRAAGFALAGSALMLGLHVGVAAAWRVGGLALVPGARLPLAVSGVVASLVAVAGVIVFLLAVRRWATTDA